MQILRCTPPGRYAAIKPWVITVASLGALTTPLRAQGFSVTPAPSALHVVWNSDLPYSLNDGPLWAGRGTNVSLTTGVAASLGWGGRTLRVTLAPTFVASQNLPFTIFRGRDSSRSVFASPWHYGAASADLPLRFGDRSLRAIALGESSIELTSGGVRAGLSSASEWWGPGIRNALVLSNNAGGVPRAFVRSANPFHVPGGRLAAELFLGTLTKSAYFDTVSSNNYRSISGALITFEPAFDSTLTLGFARVVYAPSARAVPSVARALDALVRWEALASAADTARRQEADQIFSLFGRWRIPGAGTQVYAEWARMEPPRSLREWLVAPQSTQGYTVGFESSRALGGAASALRAQFELTDLEQTAVFPDRPPPDYYTGRMSPQGYTQRGQILGAAIGPGASSQFAALDYIVPRWQVGLIAGRTRWENDAMYRQPQPSAARHDVSIYSGVRGVLRLGGYATSGQLTVQRRFNYLFQNDAYNAGETPRSAVDVQNITMEFQISR